ncbi:MULTISPECIES: hypothetical protein [Listeria]|uniref:hypothetical protein n=1 Tax=Listeria TaxID=1637 RepID=UPI000B58CD59|nr:MULTISPECIES: hypothetical protein [Listeria]
MSKYDEEITYCKQMLSKQQTRQQRLESFLNQTKEKEGQINQLQIRSHSLAEDFWRDSSSNTISQMMNQNKHYYSSQVSRVETMIWGIQKEIELGNGHMAEYKNNVQHYANLKRLEEAKNV